MKVTFLVVTALAAAKAVSIKQPEGELMEMQKETGQLSQERSVQVADKRERRFWSFVKKMVKKFVPIIINHAPKIFQDDKVGFQMSAILICSKGESV